ncbi:hypothetical protein FM125_01755 [Micrococcus lylae]|uniref:Uncharacterized protein n=1 Tax=Micrococcus lylae TaxID=1273 RepID=A0A1R4IFD5_9MICC|nr:hypothetical protein FM125_01755 [Micrococcus lylae]
MDGLGHGGLPFLRRALSRFTVPSAACTDDDGLGQPAY